MTWDHSRSTPRRWRRTGALVLVACALACAPRPERSGAAVRDSAGVAIVENSALDAPLAWRFDTDFVLGGADDGPEALSYLGRELLSADGGGNIYVLDAKAKQVAVFDPSGAFLRTIGRAGGGPGELPAPSRLAVSPGGEVWVLDYVKGGYVRWAADGTPLEEVKPVLFPPTNRQHYFEADGEGLTVATQVWDRSGGAGSRYVLRRVHGGDTVDVAAVDAPEPREVRMLECGGIMRMPALFSAELVWASGAGRLAVASSDGYVVDVYEGFSLQRSIRRTLSTRTASADDAMKEVGEGMRVRFGNAQPCLFPAARVVEQRGFAASIPWVGEVGIDGNREVWVQRRAIGPDAIGMIDVFSADGGYLGTLPEGTLFPALFLPDGRIGVVEKDEMDVPRLRVERVSGRGGAPRM